MKIKLTSVYVDDQEKALRFYTDVLGFTKKADFSNGPFRWLTVASSDEPECHPNKSTGCADSGNRTSKLPHSGTASCLIMQDTVVHPGCLAIVLALAGDEKNPARRLITIS